MATPKLALIPTGYKAGKLYSVLPQSGVGDFTFARASEATRVNEDGLIETMGNNVPRLDYTDGGCPNFLLEPQRTNSITYSEDFSQSEWIKSNTTITSGSLVSPDGSLNASTLTDNTVNGIHRLRDSISLSASTNYSLSIFAKKGTLSNIQLALINTANSDTASRVFDLENGILGESITSGATLSDSKITDYGNGWYRCEITSQFSSTPNTYQVTLATKSSGNSSNGNQVTYDGDGNGNVYLWGAQLEQGSYPTSYIPTNGSTVTRVGETCTGSGDASTFNDSEGVLMAEISALADDLVAEGISISDETIGNRVVIFKWTTTNSIKVRVASGGTNYFDKTISVSDITTINKIAIKYKQNDFSLWLNGIELETDTSGITPIGLSKLNFNGATSPSAFYGNTKQLQYFDSALTDAELETLTSWQSFLEMANAQNYTII
jgi:hypothetical protein